MGDDTREIAEVANSLAQQASVQAMIFKNTASKFTDAKIFGPDVSGTASHRNMLEILRRIAAGHGVRL